jgi:membrane associated rhomboid family serine protease
LSETVRSIPRPLVRTNQSVIVLCAVLTLLSGQEWFLLIPFIAGLLGLVFGFNPIMKFAKLFLRKEPQKYIPEDWEQQQFNQKIAVLCLGLGFLGFFMGWNAVGYVFTILVAVAAFVAILGFCIGCFILFQWKQYRYRRSIK